MHWWLSIAYFFSTQLGNKFIKEKGMEHVKFQHSDGALEAYPAVRIQFEISSYHLKKILEGVKVYRLLIAKLNEKYIYFSMNSLIFV